ncbi:MAG: hypothetical protein AAF829_12615, partial [Pseudomonadota bacterium]
SFAILPAMAGCQRIASFIEEFADQQGSLGFAFGASRLCCPILQHLLNPVPGNRRDDGRMLSVVNLILVTDTSGRNVYGAVVRTWRGGPPKYACLHDSRCRHVRGRPDPRDLSVD